MQTLHTSHSNMETKKIAPPQTPFPGCRTTKIYSAGDGHYLHLQTQFGEDRCMQFRVIVVTDTARPSTRPPVTHPQTGPITIHCATPLLQDSTLEKHYPIILLMQHA